LNFEHKSEPCSAETSYLSGEIVDMIDNVDIIFADMIDLIIIIILDVTYIFALFGLRWIFLPKWLGFLQDWVFTQNHKRKQYIFSNLVTFQWLILPMDGWGNGDARPRCRCNLTSG